MKKLILALAASVVIATHGETDLVASSYLALATEGVANEHIVTVSLVITDSQFPGEPLVGLRVEGNTGTEITAVLSNTDAQSLAHDIYTAYNLWQQQQANPKSGVKTYALGTYIGFDGCAVGAHYLQVGGNAGSLVLKIVAPDGRRQVVGFIFGGDHYYVLALAHDLENVPALISEVQLKRTSFNKPHAQ